MTNALAAMPTTTSDAISQRRSDARCDASDLMTRAVWGLWEGERDDLSTRIRSIIRLAKIQRLWLCDAMVVSLNLPLLRTQRRRSRMTLVECLAQGLNI